MKIIDEFKDFAIRGNVIDMAIGIIIGAAFGKIVTSLVNDIIMPPLGYIMGRVDFTNLFINLSSAEFASLAEAKKAGAATINYGVFLNTLLDFVIVALAIFIVIKQINRLRKPVPVAATPAPVIVDKEEQQLKVLEEIRDCLKSR